MMLRRQFLAGLVAAGAKGTGVTRLFDGAHGCAVLVDRPTRRLIAVHGAELAGSAAAPPGSTLKPLVLHALLMRGRLRAEEWFPCPGELRLAGRSFACSHPALPAAVTARTAIAYSCNCFVVHYARRFEAGELTAELEKWGLTSRSGWLGDRETAGRVWGRSPQMQSLGEDGVLVTPAALALAYCRLLSRAGPAVMGGMADAVEFGTAQRARVNGLAVGGKTGSVRTPEGMSLAWFAGFTEQAVVTVMLQGRSGGGDAAPVGGRILEAHWKGRL